ncbi:MAG: glycerophosphodiester phosphodiesterase [Pseudomonadota bacterium]|nr:glycerophosphodiester phosphodiesterase [Pseudomonadota bacterium]
MKIGLSGLFIGGVFIWGGLAIAKIDVHGHRGARAVLPENTLVAFEEALDAGVDYLELDTGVTKDNVVVVTHDQYINSDICQYESGARVEKKIPIYSLTFEELKKFDCGSLKNKKFPMQSPKPGQKIPTLAEVFDLVQKSSKQQAKTVQFNIETKIEIENPGLAPTPEEFVRLVMSVVNKYGFGSRTVLQSFDFRTLKAVRGLEPTIRISALVEKNFPSLIKIAREVRPDFISPDQSLLTQKYVNELHKLNVKVAPWTVNKAEDWKKLISWGVDGIITDDPRELIAYLKNNK